MDILVKMDRFQIKQNVLNVKSTLHIVNSKHSAAFTFVTMDSTIKC